MPTITRIFIQELFEIFNFKYEYKEFGMFTSKIGDVSLIIMNSNKQGLIMLEIFAENYYQKKFITTYQLYQIFQSVTDLQTTKYSKQA